MTGLTYCNDCFLIVKFTWQKISRNKQKKWVMGIVSLDFHARMCKARLAFACHLCYVNAICCLDIRHTFHPSNLSKGELLSKTLNPLKHFSQQFPLKRIHLISDTQNSNRNNIVLFSLYLCSRGSVWCFCLCICQRRAEWTGQDQSSSPKS